MENGENSVVSPKVRWLLSSTRFNIVSDELPVMKILDALFFGSMGTIIKHKTIGESGLPASVNGMDAMFAIYMNLVLTEKRPRHFILVKCYLHYFPKDSPQIF